MKKRSLFFCCLIVFVLSCNGRKTVESAKEDYKKEIALAQRLAHSNEYIEIDKTVLDKSVFDRYDSTDWEDKAKARAVYYRFYKHLKVVGDVVVCDIRSGKDIRIPGEVFGVLMDEIKSFNESVHRNKENGIPVSLHEFNDGESLESLLE